MADVQIHFELPQWEEAFETYRENQAIGNDVVMILSSNPSVFGYWVESMPSQFQLPTTDTLYIGAQVDRLEERVRQALSHGRPNRLII